MLRLICTCCTCLITIIVSIVGIYFLYKLMTTPGKSVKKITTTTESFYEKDKDKGSGHIPGTGWWPGWSEDQGSVADHRPSLDRGSDKEIDYSDSNSETGDEGTGSGSGSGDDKESDEKINTQIKGTGGQVHRPIKHEDDAKSDRDKTIIKRPHKVIVQPGIGPGIGSIGDSGFGKNKGSKNKGGKGKNKGGKGKGGKGKGRRSLQSEVEYNVSESAVMKWPSHDGIKEPASTDIQSDNNASLGWYSALKKTTATTFNPMWTKLLNGVEYNLAQSNIMEWHAGINYSQPSVTTGSSFATYQLLLINNSSL